MTPLAALPMYDRPETAAANDALWARVRDALRAEGLPAPEALDRATPMWDGWRAPGLVLSQTCGLPYRTALHGDVTLIGTPDYGLEGEAPGYYHSVFVARTDDPRAAAQDFATARFAYNQGESHSGWAAPQIWAEAQGFRFLPHLATGGHALSARAVAENRADIAALDAVTWRLIAAHDAALAARLKLVGRTLSAPGLPLISRKGQDAGLLFALIEAAMAALPAAERATLGLKGLVRIAPETYLAVPTPPPPA